MNILLSIIEAESTDWLVAIQAELNKTDNLPDG